MGELKSFFESFVKHMDDTIVYDTIFFNKEYNIKHNIASYYLKKAAYDKELCMIKVRNRTFFIHRKHYQKFKAFEKLKFVKVI